MKTALKVTGIVIGGIVLLVVIGIVILFVIVSKAETVHSDYESTVVTGGQIEAKYLARGDYEVSSYEETALQGFEKYTIYYPTQLKSDSATHPVVVFANGSGTPVSKYTIMMEHLASWGFIVIGTEEGYDWNGFASEMCIRHLMKLNENETISEDKENIFYQKIDLDHVGITGHSQGGVGVINAITVQEHSNIYKAAVSLSPTNKELANNIEWAYDASKIDTPIMLISGAGGGDDWVVTGEQINSIYADISADKVVARRSDTAHGLALYSADGYVTAWFMWHLQGDTEAAKAFIGDRAELFSNSLYQDQQIDIGS